MTKQQVSKSSDDGKTKSAEKPVSAVRKYSAVEVAKLAARGTMSPQVKSLAEGEGLEGVYDGPGPDVDMDDAAGDTKTVHTHVLTCDTGERFALMSFHQLATELPPMEGHRVFVRRDEQQKTNKGRRVNVFTIIDLGDG